MLKKLTVSALVLVLSSTSLVLTGCAHHHEDHPYSVRGDHDRDTYPDNVTDTRDMDQDWQHD